MTIFKASSSLGMSVARRCRGRLALAVSAALAVACSSGERPGPPAGSSGSAAPSASPSSTLGPTAFGPHWERAARSLDPLDVAEVGLREGGAGLAAGLDHPSYRAVARAALPAVPDAMLAAAPLAARARAGGDEAALNLETLIEVLRSKVVIGERMDPEGEQAAVADLLALANDAGAERALRARAVTALRLFATRGSCDEGKIPSELDE